MKFTRNIREDGRIEAVCEHGVGHTIQAKKGDYVHGCDGCCRLLTKENEKPLLEGKKEIVIRE